MPKETKKNEVNMDEHFTAISISRSEVLNAFGGIDDEDEKARVYKKVKGMSDNDMDTYICNYYREVAGKNFYDDIVETFGSYMKQT